MAYPRVEMAAGGTGFSSRSGRELGLRDCSIDCRFFDQLMDKAFKRYPEAAEDLMVTFIIKLNSGAGLIEIENNHVLLMRYYYCAICLYL